MRKQIISSLIATALVSVSTSAMAAQIDGAVNADNRFAVAITQNGNVVSKYVAPSNYDWRTTQRFSLKTPEDLKQCRVNVIVWGDNSVAEGFAGVLKGNKGHVYTGGTSSNGFASATQSSIPSGGNSNAPSNVQISAMAATLGAAPSNISNPVWGAASNYSTGSDFYNGAVPGNFAWVKPQGAGTTTNRHWVFSSPCGDLVEEEARPMDGEHFQCYKLEKGDRLKPETITISDQFGRSRAVLGTPRMLCNPSTKIHNKKEFGIQNKERHLVCYDYVKQDRVKAQELKINNQFAPDNVVSTEREMFCVPSYKEHTDRSPQKIDDRRRIRKRPEPRQQRR